MVTNDFTDLPMKIKLPEPEASGLSRIEELLANRRSVRKYAEKGCLKRSFPFSLGSPGNKFRRRLKDMPPQELFILLKSML